ncbi:hypothetical protein K466DRAFT_286388 [Polyporus arcularius HHB13444]|uniref:Uncharacterized protein n=1 Tax=Polyporus arcularius HHB13444 TaxID=1314778 RepID=A0A5C3PAE9_9APHY|nr:hypothetical protein K466DRAFT_286388 [Polyporus arcularius HHB13444]
MVHGPSGSLTNPYISLPGRSFIESLPPSHRQPRYLQVVMANLPPRLRATAPVFTPPSNSHVRPRLRPTAKAFDPAVYLSTPQPPTVSPVLEPYPQLEEYIHLAHFCCKSVAPDPDDEKDGEGFEAFLDRCYRHINSYPTLQELRAYIKTKPLTQTISRSQDWHPNLDEATR